MPLILALSRLIQNFNQGQPGLHSATQSPTKREEIREGKGKKGRVGEVKTTEGRKGKKARCDRISPWGWICHSMVKCLPSM